MVVGGTQSDDAYAQVKAMIQLKFSPKFLFLSNGANSPVEFPSKVGAGNVDGIFSSGDWFPDSKSAGNPAFVAAYIKKYGGNPFGIDSGSAEAYAVGQLIQDVAAKTHSRRQRDHHQDAAHGRLADDRGQPELGRQRQPEGRRQSRRVGRRQAPAGVPGERGATRADDPQAGLEGLGPARSSSSCTSSSRPASSASSPEACTP